VVIGECEESLCCMMRSMTLLYMICDIRDITNFVLGQVVDSFSIFVQILAGILKLLREFFKTFAKAILLIQLNTNCR